MFSDQITATSRLSMTACAVVMVASVSSGADWRPGPETIAVEGIQKYCATSWKNARISQCDWPDCTQEVFVQLLERVTRNRLITAIEDAKSRERRELNRSIWCTVQRWRRAPQLYHMGDEDSLAPDRCPATAEPPLEMACALQTATGCLTPRQQSIIRMWSEGWTITEIARDLNVSAARVSDEKYKAVKKLQSQMLA